MTPAALLLRLTCLLLCVSCSSFRDDTLTWSVDPAQTAELNALNRKLTEAYVREDVPTLRQMLSDSHVHNNIFGKPLDKDTFLQDIEFGVLEFTAYDTPQIRWYVRGEVAVATGFIEAKARRGGKPVPATRFLFTRVFVKERGHWRVLLFHNTMAGQPPQT